MLYIAILKYNNILNFPFSKWLMILTILTLCQKITFAQFHWLSNNRKKNNEQELKSFRPLWTVDQSAVMTD